MHRQFAMRFFPLPHLGYPFGFLSGIGCWFLSGRWRDPAGMSPGVVGLVCGLVHPQATWVFWQWHCLALSALRSWRAFYAHVFSGIRPFSAISPLLGRFRALAGSCPVCSPGVVRALAGWLGSLLPLLFLHPPADILDRSRWRSMLRLCSRFAYVFTLAVHSDHVRALWMETKSPGRLAAMPGRYSGILVGYS